MRGWALAILLIMCITVFLLYKGYKIVPLVEIERSTTFKGNSITGITVEMTNPWTESKQLQKIWKDKQDKEAKEKPDLQTE